MEVPSSSPKVTRATRVYGRRKQPEVLEPETHADSSLAGASPIPSINNSPAYSVSQHDLPPSSDDPGMGDTSYMDEDDDSQDGAAGSSPDDNVHDSASPTRFIRRSVREELALIDQQFDSEEMDLELQRRCETADKEDGAPLAQGDASRLSKNPFNGSPLRPSTPPQLAQESSLSSSPVPQRVSKRRLRAHDSDSDSPVRPVRQTSPQTSPETLHPINSPHTRSSNTPPTSQDMPSARRQRKGKEKEQSAEHEDSDAQPTAAESRTRRKSTSTRKTREKRVKAPSKKELLETQKATARIVADQRPTLPRHDKKLKISSLFEKLTSGLRPRASIGEVLEDPVSIPSDPIQPFSSPGRPQPNPFVPKQSALRFPSPPSEVTTGGPRDKFEATGLLESSTSRAHASSKRQRISFKKKDDVFQPSGLLDGTQRSPHADSSDEDLPDVRKIMEDDQRKRDQVEARKRLQAAKLQYVNRQAEAAAAHGTDDSDLEVVHDDMHAVAEEEDKDRRARKAKHITESVGRHHQLVLAGKAKDVRSPTKATPLRGAKKDFDLLAAAAAPSFTIESRAKRDRDAARVNPGDLNRMLLHASEKQSRELTAQKEAEFYRKVGQRRDQLPEVDKASVLQTLVKKGMDNAMRDVSDDGDDEESDGDWVPAHEQEEEEEEGESGGRDDAHAELPVATDDDDLDHETDEHDENDKNDENNENEPVKPRRTFTRPRAVIESDDDDENIAPPTGRVLVAGSSLVFASSPRLPVPQLGLHHRGSMSSMEERLEDGTDKENDSRLMFDRGDDKENTAVASQDTSLLVSPLAPLLGGGSFFTLQQSLSRTVSSPSAGGADTTLLGDERVPFKELPTGDEEEELFLSPSNKARIRSDQDRIPSKLPFGSKSHSLSPIELRGGRGLDSFFAEGELSEPGENPQETPCSLEPAAVIRSGLSQFFEPTAQDCSASSPAPLQLGKLGFTQFMTPSKENEDPQDGSSPELSLSLGPNLQPALEVDESLLRRANEIFEKEQEYVVAESLLPVQSPHKPEMFINKLGFLTQTKSSSPPTSPLFAQTSPMFAMPGSSVARRPLSTLALSAMDEDDEDDEEGSARPRRLRRRSLTPERDTRGYRSSPSPSPVKQRNAFDALWRKQKQKQKQKPSAPLFAKPAPRLGKSEFVEGEAEESDEDAAFGFGLPKRPADGDEDELDGEDQDRVLEELVDDAAMDEATLNEERVLEKVQEHRAIDDALDEKIARDAAEGKMRVKRRNNLLDFEDDESDEDDYEARRARERMAKKRRIEGDTLEEIEKNPATRAFAAAYKVEDDEGDFAHLAHDDLTLVGVPSQESPDDHEGENDENESHGVVDAVRLREQLRRVARGEETVESIDVHDVAWVDDDDEEMDDEVRVKDITTIGRAAARGETNSAIDWDLLKQPRRGDKTEDLARQQKWARSEGSSRNVGTGRASAVTGMGGKSAKAGSGTVAGRRGAESSSAAHARKQAARLAKAPSALSAVSSRRARFDC